MLIRKYDVSANQNASTVLRHSAYPGRFVPNLNDSRNRSRCTEWMYRVPLLELRRLGTSSLEHRANLINLHLVKTVSFVHRGSSVVKKIFLLGKRGLISGV